MRSSIANWVNESNTRLLAAHGVTAAQRTIVSGLESLYRQSIAQWMDKGLDAEEARIKTETDFIRPGLNRSGRHVWQIEEGQIRKLRSWITEEKKWVSSGNYERLKALGITSGSVFLERLMEKLHEEAIYAQRERGKPPRKAAAYVETHCYRKARTEQGLPTWQMHERMANEVLQAINDPDWISSHDKAAFARNGMTAIAGRIDAALEKHYEMLLSIMSETKSPEKAQEHITHHILRHAMTRQGSQAWEVHRTHMPVLVKVVRELDMRRSGDWISYTSPRLGLAGKIETKHTLMLELRNERIAFHQDKGLSEQEARMKVGLEEISLRQGLQGKHVLKINRSLIPELHKKAGHLVRPDTWVSRLPQDKGTRER